MEMLARFEKNLYLCYNIIKQNFGGYIEGGKNI